jgi:hypothetical protein
MMTITHLCTKLVFTKRTVEESCLLVYNALWFSERELMFRQMLLILSKLKSKLNEVLFAACLILILGLFSTLKMEYVLLKCQLTFTGPQI